MQPLNASLRSLLKQAGVLESATDSAAGDELSMTLLEPRHRLPRSGDCLADTQGLVEDVEFSASTCDRYSQVCCTLVNVGCNCNSPKVANLLVV